MWLGVQPVPFEEPGQRALARRQLLAPEEEVAERNAGASELDHHREAALHVRRAEANDPAVVDPAGQVVLRGHGVVVPREHDLPRIEENGVVVVRGGGGHQPADVLDDLVLAATRRSDVHQLESSEGEGIHGIIIA